MTVVKVWNEWKGVFVMGKRREGDRPRNAMGYLPTGYGTEWVVNGRNLRMGMVMEQNEIEDRMGGDRKDGEGKATEKGNGGGVEAEKTRIE